MPNFSFEYCVDKAIPLIKSGWEVHQKFTCERCGVRNEVEEPNKFFELGTCGECGFVTDLKRRGCGYCMWKPISID